MNIHAADLCARSSRAEGACAIPATTAAESDEELTRPCANRVDIHARDGEEGVVGICAAEGGAVYVGIVINGIQQLVR